VAPKGHVTGRYLVSGAILHRPHPCHVYEFAVCYATRAENLSHAEELHPAALSPLSSSG